jgi:hypothetical protein
MGKKITDKFREFLNKKKPLVKSTDDIDSFNFLDFIKSNEKLGDYVNFIEDYKEDALSIALSSTRLNLAVVDTIPNWVNNLKGVEYFKFEYNNDVVTNISDRLSSLFKVNGANIYIGLSNKSKIIFLIELDISETGFDQIIIQSSDNEYNFMRGNKFYLLSFVNPPVLVDYLNKSLVSWIRFFGIKWDLYMTQTGGVILKKIEHAKKSYIIQSKLDDIKDILVDLIDLSHDYNIIKNQDDDGGVSAFFKINRIVKSNTGIIHNSVSININKKMLEIFDILLEVRPRIESLFDCDFIAEFSDNQLNLFISAKK